MDEAWIAYLVMILLIVTIIVMKQKPDDEVKREKETESRSTPTTYYGGGSGRTQEFGEEEMAVSMERLTSIMFSSDARKREPHQEHRSSSSGKEQARTSHPGSHDKTLVDEIEQAVQEAAETEVHARRRQPQLSPRSRLEGEWTEMK